MVPNQKSKKKNNPVFILFSFSFHLHFFLLYRCDFANAFLVNQFLLTVLADLKNDIENIEALRVLPDNLQNTLWDQSVWQAETQTSFRAPSLCWADRRSLG